MKSEREGDISSALPHDLDALPHLRGFRMRGVETTRLETFIDAAFAFAITVLVISASQVPETIAALIEAFRNVPAFVASIIVLGIFWRGHWLWSRRFGLEDGVSIFISWGMIVTILIYVFPLRLLFGAMFHYLSGGTVGHRLIVQALSEVRALYAFYALGFAILAFEILLLNLWAFRLQRALHLNAREIVMTRHEVWGWSLPVTIGLTSFTLALTLPISHLDWCGWIFFSLAILVPLHRRWRRRRLGALSN